MKRKQWTTVAAGFLAHTERFNVGAMLCFWPQLGSIHREAQPCRSRPLLQLHFFFKVLLSIITLFSICFFLINFFFWDSLGIFWRSPRFFEDIDRFFLHCFVIKFKNQQTRHQHLKPFQGSFKDVQWILVKEKKKIDSQSFSWDPPPRIREEESSRTTATAAAAAADGRPVHRWHRSQRYHNFG